MNERRMASFDQNKPNTVKRLTIEEIDKLLKDAYQNEAWKACDVLEEELRQRKVPPAP
jgi:hypothetical protein